MEDYYGTLEIGRDATTSDIRAAYRRLALQWHPDKNPENREEATTKFKQISAAYEVLSERDKRLEYDRRGRQSQSHGTPEWTNPNAHTTHATSLHPFEFAFGFRSADEIFKDFFKDDPFLGGSFFQSGSGSIWDQQPGQSNAANMSFSVSTSTRQEFVNGKMTETRIRTANNVQTTEVYEDGVLVSSRTIGGGAGGGGAHQQPLTSTTTSTAVRSRTKPKNYRHYRSSE